jgi:hypothetical protein
MIVLDEKFEFFVGKPDDDFSIIWSIACPEG